MTKTNLYVVSRPARSAEVKNTLSGIVDALSHHPEWAGELLEAWTNARTTETGELPFWMSELLELGLGVPAQSQNPRVTARVSRVLARLGYRKRKRSSLPRTFFYSRKPEVSVLPSCRPRAPGESLGKEEAM